MNVSVVKKLKVAFINPPAVNNIKFTREGKCQEREEVLSTSKPPLSLAILTSLFKEKFEILTLDLQVKKKLVKDLKEFSPHLIFFPTTTPTIKSDIKFFSNFKESLLFCFGPHPSGIPEETLKEFPQLKGVIVGEPEFTSLEIAERIKEKISLRGVKGLVYREKEEIVFNPLRELIQTLDILPEPSWEFFPLQYYKIPFLNIPYLLVETSRGCPYKCSFCVVPLIHGNIFRIKSVEKIVQEIENGIKKFKINFFHFWADSTFLKKESAIELADAILKKNLKIRFVCNLRPEAVEEESAKFLKKAGCFMVSFGGESANSEFLEKMNKKLNLEKIEKAVRILKKNKIKTAVFFIIGYPGETEKEIENTFKFAMALSPDYLTFYPAVPYPGTELYKIASSQGKIKTKDWRKYEYSYYVLEDENLNEEKIMKLQKKFYLRYYLRISFILQQFGVIKSIRGFFQLIYRGVKVIWRK
jgi:anaerobic magnesium-protoporphyrin IX monomethyl ester cyclase